MKYEGYTPLVKATETDIHQGYGFCLLYKTLADARSHNPTRVILHIVFELADAVEVKAEMAKELQP